MELNIFFTLELFPVRLEFSERFNGLNSVLKSFDIVLKKMKLIAYFSKIKNKNEKNFASISIVVCILNNE